MEQFNISEPVFGNWFIKRKIGESALSAVYEIECDDFGRIREAALKVISVPKSENDIKAALKSGVSQAELKERFSRFVEELLEKISAMYKLKGNTNIVRCEEHTAIQHKDGIGWDVLIRMEKLTPLPDYFAQHQPNQRGVINLGIDICRALEFCRKLNIIHGDIRPSNIFVSDSGDFKLGDFGIAGTVKNNLGFLIQENISPYIAPEIYSGRDYDLSADIYSLGVILYQYLNFDRTPFLPPYPQGVSREDRESAALLCVHGKKMPPPAGASGDLSAIILNACAYKPSERYSDPALFKDDLYAMLVLMGKNGEKVPDYSPREDEEDNFVGNPSRGKSRKILILAAVLTALAVIVLLAVFLTHGDGDGNETTTASSRSTSASAVDGTTQVDDGVTQPVTEIVTDTNGNVIMKTEYTSTGKIVTQSGFNKELLEKCTYVHTYSVDEKITETKGTYAGKDGYFEISYYSDGPKLDMICYDSGNSPLAKFSYSKPDASGRATARNDYVYDTDLKKYVLSGSAELEYEGSGISKITEYDTEKKLSLITEFSGESLLRKTSFINGVKTSMREYYITEGENIGTLQRLTEYNPDGSYSSMGYDQNGEVTESFFSESTTASTTSATTSDSAASLEPVPRRETTTADRFSEGLSRFADWLF